MTARTVRLFVVLLTVVLSLHATEAKSVQEAFCFSGRATVSVFGKGVVQMKDLQVGDYVVTGTMNRWCCLLYHLILAYLRGY